MGRPFIFLTTLLILLGLGVSLWNWAFGLPLFITGALLLAFSKLRAPSKLLWLLIPVIVFYSIGWVIRSEFNNATPETFLIPSSQQGKFRVVYGESCGITPEIKDGRRLLHIPSDGILLIQPTLENGWLDQKFYVVALNGEKELISVNGKKINDSQPNVFISGPTAVSFNINNSNAKSERLEYNYVDFEINRKDTIYYLHDGESNQLDSLTKAKVTMCRSNDN